MADPVLVEMPLELMREIRDTLRTCAQDLDAELEVNYPAELRKQYPTYQRRWSNDIEPARKAAQLADAINMQPWAYHHNFNRES